MVLAQLLMVAVMVVAAGALPPLKGTSPQPPPQVRLGPVLFPGEGGDMKTDASDLRLGQRTIECEKIDGAESTSCNQYCRLLPRRYERGDCIDGRCHCREAEKITCKVSCPTYCKSLGQEGLCIADVCHCHDVELKCERHESCSSHCRALGHTESQCREGICRCGMTSDKLEKRPVSCEELVSVGEEQGNRNELCLGHCQTLREGYRRGECKKGICHCSV